jgi:hypothetical protein
LDQHVDKSQVEQPVVASTPEPGSRTKPAKNTPSFPPIAAPPVPLSPDKQERLAVLLHRYQIDEISPEQYHAARAKILAEP